MKGKIALVTGASDGIGFGIASAFAKRGATLAICARRTEKLAAAAGALSQHGGPVLALPCDVMAPGQIAAFVAAVAREFGRVDVLVNNACTMPAPSPLETTTDEALRMSLASGVEASFLFMRECFPLLPKPGGKVINLTSATAIRGIAGNTAYGVTKGAIISLTRTAASDWARHGINVNCLSPFAMSEALGNFLDQLPEDRRADPFAAIGINPVPLGRLGDAELDIGAAAVFLAGRDSDYITGHILPVDGGMIEIG